MKKNILNKKFTFLTAATLTAVSAGLVANSNTAKAAELANEQNNGTQSNNAIDTAQTNRVTNQDVQNAQNDVNQAQTRVNNAQEDVKTAQNKVDKVQQDLQNTQANKPQVDQNEQTQNQQAINQAQQDVEQKEQAVSDAQNKANQAQNQVVEKQQNAQNAQSQAKQAQNDAQKAQQIAQSAQQDLNKAQANAEQDKTVNTSKLTASQGYIDAVKKYNNGYVSHVQEGLRDGNQQEIDDSDKYGMNASDFDATMQKVSDESYNLKSNNYIHNEYDHNRKVNINHLTDDEQKELSNFAAGIMNDMNKQVGLPEFSVNSDTQKMANDIAKGYIEDNRNLFDGKSHDFDRINRVAKDYGLNNTTGNSQYYENAAGWIIGAGHVTGNNSDESGWYENDANPGETNMDEIKAGIYNSLKVMYFNHHEWYHAFGLLKSAEYNSNVYPDRKITYHFAYAASALPNSNEVTDHFIIVSDSNKQNGSKINNANDQTVADLETTIARVNNDQTALKIAKLNLDKANDQATAFNARYVKAQQALEDATKQVQTAQRLARLANTKLESAKQDLANSKANLQKQLDIQKQAQNHYTESQKKLAQYQELIAEKQNELDNANQNLAEKQTALQNAEKNLLAKQTKLAQIKAIKSAQDLADQTAKENQKHDQSESNKPVDKPDQGKTTDTTKPVDKPDQGKTTDTTKPVDKPDQGKTTDTTKPVDKLDQSKTTDTTKPVDKPDQSKTTDTTKPVDKPDQGKTTDTTKPVDKPDQGKTTDTTKPVNEPDQGKTTDTTKPVEPTTDHKESTTDDTKKSDDNRAETPVESHTTTEHKSTHFKPSHPSTNVVNDDLAKTPVFVDNLASAPVRKTPKFNITRANNGKITLTNENGQVVARQFVNIHDLIQYLLRNYKGEITIDEVVTLSGKANAYILTGNNFNKTTIQLPAKGQYTITALKIENGHIYAKIANTQFWVDAKLLK